MSHPRNPSPARSQGAPVTRRNRSRTRSVGSPARSNTSGRLSALVQFKEVNKDSFVLSPAPSRRSVLNDDTNIEEPRRRSWWKQLGDNSRDVMEVLNDDKVLETNEAVEEYIDIEVLSQEKKHYSIDIPDSSDGESISSIVIPQRKLFTQKDQGQNKFGKLVGKRETLAKLQKSHVADKSVHVAPKNLFGQGTKTRPKPVFPAALLNLSPNKTVNKTKENVAAEVKGQVRNLFGNRAGTKRKNMFADFIVSESEDEISEIQPRVFEFPRKPDARRDSANSRGKREHSSTSSVADIEMDDWKMLPSSTMVENQLEDMMATAKTPKRARLSNLPDIQEATKSTAAQNEKEPSDEEQELKYDDEDDKSDRSEQNQNRQSIKNVVGNKIAVENDSDEAQNEKVEKQEIITEVYNKTTENNTKQKELRNESQKNKSKVDVEIENDEANDMNDEEQNESAVDGAGEAQSDNEQQNDIEVEQQSAEVDAMEEDAQSETEDQNESAEVEQTNAGTEIDSQVQNESKNESAIQESYNKANRNSEIQDDEAQKNDEIQEDDSLENAKVQEEGDEEQENSQNRSQQTRENVVVNESKAENNKESQVKSLEEISEVRDQTRENSQEHDEVDNDVQNERDKQNDLNEQQNETEEDAQSEYEQDESQNEGAEVEAMDADAESGNEEQNESQNEAIQESEDEQKNESDEIEDIDENAQSDNEQDEIDNEDQDESESEVEAMNDEAQSDNEEDENESAEVDQMDEDTESENEQDENESAEVDQMDEDAESDNEPGENESAEVEQMQDAETDNEDQNETQNETALQESEDEAQESAEVQDDKDEQNQSHQAQDSDNEIEDSNERRQSIEEQNVTHDTTGRHRKKHNTVLHSPEAILHDKTNQLESFTAQGRNTSIRKTMMLKNLTIRPSLAPPRESTGLSDGTTNSSAEGSGWDSHRTTRKTLRQTFGRDFTPRKSLRALVMEKSAKRQTVNEIASVTVKFPQANSTELPEASICVNDCDVTESNHDMSKRTRQTTLEMYLQKIKKQNMERKQKMEEAVRSSLKAPTRDILNPFKVPSNPIFSKRKPNKPAGRPKARPVKSALIPLDDLPAEVVEDMKYKPPKRFQPSNAPWITKRLYKFLETKLEPKYDYKARVRAEKLVEHIYQFCKDLRRADTAPTVAVDALKLELARLDVVKTHFDFYQFFHEYMPREMRVKVVPDVVNKISVPRHGVFSDILRGNTVQG